MPLFFSLLLPISSLLSPLRGTLMPRRSKVEMLPAEVRTEVEHKMTTRAFSGYQQLAKELEAQGYEISDDSLQRHGAKLHHDLETIRLSNHYSKIVGEAAP